MRAPNLSLPWAVVIGAAIIAGAIVAPSFIAPYRISSASPNTWHIVNTITGETRVCGDTSGGGFCRSGVTPR